MIDIPDRPGVPVLGAGGVASLPASAEILVDPAVSRSKFDTEIAAYRAHEQEHRARGWFMVEASYPTVFMLMIARKLRPSTVQFALHLDFTNYDLWPPSLRFVDPFTGAPLPVEQVSKVPQPAPMPPVEVADAIDPQELAANRAQNATNLVQGHLGYPAFLCVEGTKEYHDHPYHTNNPWLAHRGTGVGKLYYLLDVIDRHGLQTLNGYQIEFNMRPGHDLSSLL